MNNNKSLVGALAVVTLVAVYGFVRPGPGVVEATEFRLIDADGTVLAVLKKGDKGGRLVFQYKNGDPAIVLAAESGPALGMYNDRRITIVGLGGTENGGLSLHHGSGFGGLFLSTEQLRAPKLELGDGRRTIARIGPGREFAIYDHANTKRFSAGLLWDEADPAGGPGSVSLRWFAPNGETVVKEITAEDK